METHWLHGLGDTWDPPSTQADSIRLDEPSARGFGMVPAGSLASSSASGHSVAARSPPSREMLLPLAFFFFNAHVQN